MATQVQITAQAAAAVYPTQEPTAFTGATDASLARDRVAGVWYFQDLATMTSNVDVDWAYIWPDGPLEYCFM